MIFPEVRLSELKADVELKRRQLENSSENIKASLSDLSRPLNFLKKNPLTALGGLVSTLVAFKAATGLFKKRGFLGKVAAFGGAMFARNVLPLATRGVLAGLDALYKKKKNRSS